MYVLAFIFAAYNRNNLDFSIMFIVAALLAFAFCSVEAATPAQWRGRSIYQVFTDRFARTDGSVTAFCPSGYEGYCGGTWQGIIKKLDYIQGMGFTAIWISPVVEQVTDPTRGYTGYAAQNIYGLNGNFGTAEELQALATALHDRGMVIILQFQLYLKDTSVDWDSISW